MSFSFADVEKSINGLRSKLQCASNESLQDEFDAGLHPNLLSYHKTQTTGVSLPVLEKYLVGALSYLHQPSNYYDIFGACRSVIIVELLDATVEVLQAKQVKGLATRIERLVRAVDPDVFDSVAFELITAARYAVLSSVDCIEFIDEKPPKKTPDIFLSVAGVDSFVECKKAARAKDFNVITRNTVRDLLNGVISTFREQGVSVLAEVVFNCDPQTVGRSRLLETCQAAIHDRTVIITPQITVKATRLPKYESKDYTLYPSPRFSWIRYGYRIRSEWFGIVHQLFGKPARRANLTKHLQGGVSTWLDTVEWDAAIKWRIGAENVSAKYRRFGFDGLFQAVEQINGAGLDSTVHLWLETDHFIGGRREVLLDFFKRLSLNARHTIGWIVINETLLDISPKGRFDLIEHAHLIQGPTATTALPLVSGVLASSSPSPTTDEFGVGNEMPDIDED
jgi:hypothetical protein